MTHSDTPPPTFQASCPESGHDAPNHPPGGYHVLKRVSGGYLAVTSKRLSRWDPVLVPAWWETDDAARKWVRREFPGQRYLVEECTSDLPCLLKPKRSKHRPVKISLEQLQQATGLTGGKAAILRAIAERFL